MPSLIWAALSFVSFLCLSSEVREYLAGSPEMIGGLDQSILEGMTSLRHHGLSDMAVDITALGSTTILTLFILCAGLWAALAKHPRVSLQIVLSGLGAGLLSRVLKVYFERPRPPETFRLVTVEGFSYPSGHSLASAAVYFTFALLSLFFFQSRILKLSGFVFFSILILCIGFSRMYLGVHFFSDVMAGLFLGLTWACLLNGILELTLKSSKNDGE